MKMNDSRLRKIVREAVSREHIDIARRLANTRILSDSERKIIDSSYLKIISQIKETPDLMGLWQNCRVAGREFGAEESAEYAAASFNAAKVFEDLPLVKMIARIIEKAVMRLEAGSISADFDDDALRRHVASLAVIHSMPFYAPAQWDSFSDSAERVAQTLALSRQVFTQ